MITNLRISGMSCNHCIHSVDRALRGVPNVTSVHVELGRATIEHADVIPRAVLVTAIESAGYEVSSEEASSTTG